MREIIKLGLILLLITSISAVVLGLTNVATKDIIEETEAGLNETARKEVLSEAFEFKEVDSEIIIKAIKDNEDVLEVYEGLSDSGEVVGYAIKSVTSGYGGDVQVITGISKEGIITGMNVVSHQETPGLGANATGDEFQSQFSEVPTKKEVVVVKSAPQHDDEIQALTGATITSDTVVKGVNSARELYNSSLK